MPTLASLVDGECACCVDGETLAEFDNSDPGVCDTYEETVELSPCAVSWSYFFDPHSTGDRLMVNGEDLGGCDPDVFDPDQVEGTILVSESGTTLDISIEGCCGEGERRSSWEGYIVQNC